MSLDVWLTWTGSIAGGEPREMTLFDANITHNLGQMWSAAGIYEPLYNRSGEVKFAKDLLPLIESGLSFLKSDPYRFRRFDASNGWGTYKDALPWLEKLVAACREYPDAEYKTSY